MSTKACDKVSVRYTPAERMLVSFLRWIAGFWFIAAIVTFATLYLDKNIKPMPPFFVSNTIGGICVVGLVAWYASADVRRFRSLVYWLGIGYIITILTVILFYIHSARTLILDFLIVVTIIQLFLLLFFIARARLYYLAKDESYIWTRWTPALPAPRWIAIVLWMVGITYTLVGIVPVVLVASGKTGWYSEPLFAIGFTLKYILTGFVITWVAKDIMRYVPMMIVFIIDHFVTLFVTVLFPMFGLDPFQNFALTIGDLVQLPPQMIVNSFLVETAFIIGAVILSLKINQESVGELKFLRPYEFRVLEAVSETLISADKDGSQETIPPHVIVQNADRELDKFGIKQLQLGRLALIAIEFLPMLAGLPPLTYLDPHSRCRFVYRHFEDYPERSPIVYRLLDLFALIFNFISLKLRGIPERKASDEVNFSDLVAVMLRFAAQMTYLGYYSDPKVHKAIAYVPFSQRATTYNPPLTPTYIAPIKDHNLQVIEAKDLPAGDTITVDADVLIIGSGAAGGMIAHQLAQISRDAKKPLKIVMLEKGPYVRPQEITEDEILMSNRLYGDSGFQLSQSLRFNILQGSCVGGTTVVNNAVSFDTPPSVLNKWNSRATNKVIDEVAFQDSQAKVRTLMQINKITAGTRQPLEEGVLNHGDKILRQGITALLATGTYKYDVVDANITDCLGCGYCNIGCKYGRKLSMLDYLLPKTQKEHGVDQFKIYSEAQVHHIVTQNNHVTEVQARSSNGKEIKISNPKAVILSAGTIASSWLLQQSGIGKDLPVGQGISFNMGTPIYGLSEDQLNSFDGLQMSHYLRLKDTNGQEILDYVYETWYNPPITQALTMPGWLDVHFNNMQNYSRIAAVGILIGTESNARIQRNILTKAPDVVYVPTESDVQKVISALSKLGEILFAGGAKKVYFSLNAYHAGFTKDEFTLDALKKLIKSDRDLFLASSHPQGGNAIGFSKTSGESGSVIDADFRVFGYDNLFVCDASVHPTATTVNPQLTIMTLAHYASPRIYSHIS